eukprot:EG_transcript_9889
MPLLATTEDTTETEEPEVAPSPFKKGREVYSPNNYQEIVQDAVAALLRGMATGQRLLEVEYPVLPTGAEYSTEGNLWEDACFLQALDAARLLHKERQFKIHILLSDNVALGRFTNSFAKEIAELPYVTVGSPKGRPTNPLTAAWQAFGGIGTSDETFRRALEGEKVADLFLVILDSAYELGDIEQYYNEKVGEHQTFVLWNPELDTLRADLGLPGYPSEDLHYRFYCKFLPVFFIRPREYSKTVFETFTTFDYEGALFREFPGPWQVMYKQKGRGLVSMAQKRRRYSLYQFKQELLKSLGMADPEGSFGADLEKGVRKATWFEEENDLEVSKTWRL